jgi:hypothetical protein
VCVWGSVVMGCFSQFAVGFWGGVLGTNTDIQGVGMSMSSAAMEPVCGGGGGRGVTRVCVCGGGGACV